MIDRSFTEAFSLKLGLKDLRYMKELYNAYGVPAFALDGGIELLERCVEEGRGDRDFSECAAGCVCTFGTSGIGRRKGADGMEKRLNKSTLSPGFYDLNGDGVMDTLAFSYLGHSAHVYFGQRHASVG